VPRGAVTYPVDDPQQAGNEIISPPVSRPATPRKIVPAHVLPADELPTTNIRWCFPPAACSKTGTRLDDAALHGARSDRAEAVAFMSPKDMRR